MIILLLHKKLCKLWLSNLFPLVHILLDMLMVVLLPCAFGTKLILHRFRGPVWTPPHCVPVENWIHGTIWDSGFCTCDRNQEMTISRDETAPTLPAAPASAQKTGMAATAENANKLITSASCNYYIHWGARSGSSRTGHDNAAAPETGDTLMLMGHRTKWPSVAESKLYHL